MSELPRAWKAHAVLGAVPLSVWSIFHLWEQWAAFFGRDAFLARLRSTSTGAIALISELALVIVPVAAFAILEVRLRLRGDEPQSLRLALAEEPGNALRLRRLALASTWIAIAFFAYHAAWLWAPKLAGGEPIDAWLRLRALGTWPHTLAHAIGLTAIAIHLWAAITRLAIGLEWAASPQNRRAWRLSAAIGVAGSWFLYGELAGFHASGAGTFWSL